MNLTMPKLLRTRRQPATAPAPSGLLASESVGQLQHQLRTVLTDAGQEFFEFGEIVVDEAVANCRVFASRHRAIESLPKGGVVAEVGTQTGRFADHIFRAAEPRKLHLFDISMEWFDRSVLVEPIRRGQVQIHIGDSSSELAKFPAEHFDWLYIDGDHSYAGVKRDISEAVRVVKRNGLLVFNDYTVWSPLEVANYGVLKAVNELVNSGEWEFVYLALHPWSYHDAALRRRAA